MQRGWKIAIGVLVSIALVWLLLREVALRDIREVFAELKPAYVFLAFCAYALCYLCRAIRFRTLLMGKLSLAQLFSIVCLHNFFTNLLPSRTGELSYLYLTKQRGIPLPQGIATLLLARLFDFLLLATIFIAAMLSLSEVPLLIAKALWAIVLFLALIAVFLILLLWLGERFLTVLRALFRALRLHRIRLLSMAMRKLQEGVVAATAVRSPRYLGSLLLSSMMIWLFQYLTYYSLVQGMGLEVSLLKVIVAISFISLASAIPIQGIAGFGVNEGWWTLSYTALGLEKTLAISSAFVQHITVVIFYAVLALVGMLMLHPASKTTRRTA